jgi:hypothetical protein
VTRTYDAFVATDEMPGPPIGAVAADRTSRSAGAYCVDGYGNVEPRAGVQANPRFGAIGLLCACISIAVLIGLCELALVNYLLAYFIVANICGYLLNGHYTFHSSNHLKRKSFAVYVLVNCVSPAINSLGGPKAISVASAKLFWPGLPRIGAR